MALSQGWIKHYEGQIIEEIYRKLKLKNVFVFFKRSLRAKTKFEYTSNIPVTIKTNTDSPVEKK